MANDEFREAHEERREHGLKVRHETREDRFHERVREVLAEGLEGAYWASNGLPYAEISAEVAEMIAPAGYQALLDAGYVVIPASEEAS